MRKWEKINIVSGYLVYLKIQSIYTPFVTVLNLFILFDIILFDILFDITILQIL